VGHAHEAGILAFPAPLDKTRSSPHVDATGCLVGPRWSRGAIAGRAAAAVPPKTRRPPQQATAGRREPVAASTALLAALVVPGGIASASTTAECTDQIGELRAAVATASFVNAKDATTSDAKLQAAEEKLAVGKNADAIAKVVDFRTRIERLAVAGKLGGDDAATLTAGADGVIACIEAVEPAP